MSVFSSLSPCKASLFAALFLAVSWLSSPSNAEVVSLTDATFEHQTQASTGMTTGSWFVLFSVPDCKPCDDLKPILEDLSKDEEVFERGIVMGSVDCSESQSVCMRFSTSKLPVLLYLHKKQLYRYPRENQEFEITIADLKEFVLSPSVEGEAIPNPPSALDSFLKPILLIAENNPLAGYAIFGMVGMMGFTVLVLLVALLKGGSSTDSKKTKTKTKKSKKKD